MSFKYVWKNKESNFGKPLKYQVKGGTHITFEIMMISLSGLEPYFVEAEKKNFQA